MGFVGSVAYLSDLIEFILRNKALYIPIGEGWGLVFRIS